MTYGQVAALAGNAGGARQVARILHSMSSKYNLPWHRVISSKGTISIRDPEGALMQKVLLEKEGVRFSGDRTVSLSQYRDKGSRSPDHEK